jgi:hypothetical protein
MIENKNAYTVILIKKRGDIKAELDTRGGCKIGEEWRSESN